MKTTSRPGSRLTNMKLASRIAASALAGVFFLLATPAFSQAASPVPPPAGVQSKTLWEQIKEGGWVMYPIALCSIATLYLIGDCIIRTSRKKAAPPEQEEALKTLFRQGDYVGSYNYCKEHVSPLTNVLRVGIRLLGEGKQVSEEGMLGEWRRRIRTCKPTSAISPSSAFAAR